MRIKKSFKIRNFNILGLLSAVRFLLPDIFRLQPVTYFNLFSHQSLKKLTILICAIFISTSCLRLDDFLYNNDDQITAYLYDDYEGEVDFKLDSTYDIPSHLLNEFTLVSESKEEGVSYIIYALYIGDISRIGTDTVIFYCHGNRDHMDFYWQRAKLLANTGGKNRFGVLMIDYRGFGLSEGKPSETGLFEDVDAGIKWLKANGLSSERLIMYGFSMGSAPAVHLTAYSEALKPEKLILEAPFASSEVMGQDATKLSLPASFFTDLKINNADKIRDVKQDLLWFHGMEDDFLSIETHGEVVFKNHGGNFSKALRVEGGSHGDVPEVFGFEEYLGEVLGFLIGK